MLHLLMTFGLHVFGGLISADVVDLPVDEDGMLDVVFRRTHEALLHLVLQLHVILRREAETSPAQHTQTLNIRHDLTLILHSGHSDPKQFLKKWSVQDPRTFVALEPRMHRKKFNGFEEICG